MTFLGWLLDPRTMVAAALLVPLYFGFCGEKSTKVVVMAIASNIMWLVGAELSLKLTGVTTAVITIIVGSSFVVLVPVDLARSRAHVAEDEKISGEILLATTRFRDVTTPVLDLVMIFCGQTMLVVLYMKEMCRIPLTPFWFNPGLWACGWVGQFMVYTQFGFDFGEEVEFWRRIMTLSLQKLRVRKDDKEETIEIDAKELAFRSVLSCVVNIVYRVFIWMSLPIYVARGHGGIEVSMKLVAVLYVMKMADLVVPVMIDSASSASISEADVFARGTNRDMDLEQTPLNMPLVSEMIE